MKASNANFPDLPWDHEIAPGRTYWGLGLVVALLLLTGQILYFEGVTFSRNPTFRPNLEKISRYMDYQLPAYKSLSEFSTLQGSLSALPNRNQLFKAIIRNQATFAQPYPNLDLTLLDYAGNPSARRIFRPQDYLPEAQAANSAVLPGATIEISLNIAALNTKISGYTFELIY